MAGLSEKALIIFDVELIPCFTAILVFTLNDVLNH
jgi:hypothetical protein